MKMYENFMIDIETIGDDSYAGILSIGIVPFNLDGSDSNVTIEELRERSYYRKFDIVDQLKNLKVSKKTDTINWWKEQDEDVKKRSILPSEEDVKIGDEWFKMKEWIYSQCNKYEVMFWQRGCFEQHILQGMNDLLGNTVYDRIDNGFFSRWMEVRTALRLLHGNDYCKNFNKKGTLIVDYPDWENKCKQFKKHDPVSDAMIDVIYLLYARS